VLLSWSGLFDLCCNSEFGFWISLCGKLLAFAMCFIVVHSFVNVLVTVGASACM